MAEKSFDKLIDTIGSMTVIELSKFIKELEETLGVSAAMPMMGAAAPVAAQAAPAAEEKAEYKITLENSGAEKIKTIKALRAALPELNLTDAKRMVEEAPQVIKEAAPKADAMKIKEALEAAGAKVTLA